MDLTIDAEVVKCANPDIGEYKVQYQSNVFSAFCTDPTITYNKGERVYVLVPQGDFSTKKIILGYSKYESNLSQSDLTDLSNLYIEAGPNWYSDENYKPDHNPLQVCAVPGVVMDTLTEDANFEDVGFQRKTVTDNFYQMIHSIDYQLYNADTDGGAEYRKTIDARMHAFLQHRFVDNATENFEELHNIYQPVVQQASNIDWKLYEEDETYRRQIQQSFDYLNNDVEEIKTRPAVDKMDVDELEGIDQRFKNYAQAYGFIKIAADFHTTFEMPHDQGQYWLRVTFLARNRDYRDPQAPDADLNRGQPEYILMDFDLGFRQFNGAPYQFVVPTPQKAYYKVDAGILVGLHRVSLMQDGEFIADITPSYNLQDGSLEYLNENRVLNRNNIFCDNIEIKFCQRLDMLDTPYYCWIDTPQGDKLYKQSTIYPIGRTHIDLVPHYIHMTQEITKDCQIRWFREDLSVFPSTPTQKDEFDHIWTDYTGPGWRPVEDLNDIDLNYWTVNDDGSLTVYQSGVPYEWRFKVVCIHNTGDVFGTATITVRNLDSKYNLYIEKFETSDSKKINLRINEMQPRRVNIDPMPKDQNQKYPEWFGTWYVQLQDNSYIQMAENSTYVRGPVDISNYMIYDTVTFRVACYDPVELLPEFGVGEITEAKEYQPVAYLEKTMFNITDAGLLIDWIGQKNFNYTAAGKAYPTVSKNEYTLQPKLKMPEDVYADYQITVIAPDGAALGSRNFYNQNLQNGVGEDGNLFINATANGHSPLESMMKEMYVDSNDVVHFKVAQEYAASKDKNTLVARVLKVSTGEWFEAPCVVNFTKDGQSGTQGTGWTAPLDLVNSQVTRRKIWHPTKGEYVDMSQPAYTMPIELPAYPLVIKRNGTKTYQDKSIHRLFVRPFPTKDGQSLMDYSLEGKNYKIIITWDVRQSKDATFGPAKNSSFLRLRGMDGNLITLNHNELTGYERGVTNPRDSDGMYGQSMWDGTNRDDPDNKYFGAVEVEWFDNQDALDRQLLDGLKEEETQDYIDIMAASGWQFLIKATIDIYSNMPNELPRIGANGKYEKVQNNDQVTFDDNGKLKQEYTTTHAFTPTIEKVKQIVSYLPIDVFIQDSDGAEEFNAYNIDMNWPSEIIFDSRGYTPQIHDCFLNFKYGARPGIDQSIQPIEIVPQSLINRLATVEEVKDEKVNQTYTTWDGEEVSLYNNGLEENKATLEQNEAKIKYKYKPRSHINWQEGRVGVLRGKIPNIPSLGIPGGTFYRNQVFQVNNFENVDINGWDGYSIDINEENGTIFAPTIGSGYKNPLTNKFTGVLMGINTGFPREIKDDNGNVIPNSGVNQLAQVGMTQEELKSFPYMTGLFGYQDGWSSFGLLENGTAFFGRADRGGRIIIDGYNATIYGGANGVFGSPKIGDPMWNCMRLTMVDLSHSVSGDASDYYNKNDPIGKSIYKDSEGTYTENQDECPGDSRNRQIDEDFFNQGETDESHVETTAVQGITQGFGGGYFGQPGRDNLDPYKTIGKLPSWYKMIWQGAYLKPTGELPYWYPTKYNELTDKEVWLDDNGEPFAEPPKDAKLKRRFKPNPANVPPLGDERMPEEIRERGAGDGTPENMGGAHYGPVIDDEGNTAYVRGNYNFSINYWNPSIKEVRAYTKRYAQIWDDSENPKATNVTGFGPSRASTTPAIEIGQHPPGLMPGVLPIDANLEQIYREMYIPGDRNFMVTYDGTMWAMNGVFMGNILGSNIIGGRMVGTEIGIGDPIEVGDLDGFTLPQKSNWGEMKSAELKRLDEMGRNDQLIDFFEQIKRKSHILPNGRAAFKEVFIYGGEIHLGTFHILGDLSNYGLADDVPNNKEEKGHLLQYGLSEFMGPTHFYSSVGIAPDFTDKRNRMDSGAKNQSSNLFQTLGLAALGIIAPVDENGNYSTEFHKWISEKRTYTTDKEQNTYFMDQKTGKNVTNGIQYNAVTFECGKPKICNVNDGKSVEQVAMFAVNTSEPVRSEDFEEAIPTTGNNTPNFNLDGFKEYILDLENYRDWFLAHWEEMCLGDANVDVGDPEFPYGSFSKNMNTFVDKFLGLANFNVDLKIQYTRQMGEDILIYDSVNAEFMRRCDEAIQNEELHQNSVTQAQTAGSGKGFKGHFWPMAFRYNSISKGANDAAPTSDLVHGYMTTMDIFQSNGIGIKVGKDTDAGGPLTGANYFRVGPWGQEGCRYYICAGWQPEEESVEPTVKRRPKVYNSGAWKEKDTSGRFNVRGIMGVVDRAGTGNAAVDKTISPAIGMESWGSAPMIIQCDENYMLNGRFMGYFRFGAASEENRAAFSAGGNKRFEETWWLKGGHRQNLIFSNTGKKEAHSWTSWSQGSTYAADAKWKSSTLSLGISQRADYKSVETPMAPDSKVGGLECVPAGLLLDPHAKHFKHFRDWEDKSREISGVYLWGLEKTPVHIMQKDSRDWAITDDSNDINELYLYQNQASLVGKSWVFIGIHEGEADGYWDKVHYTHVPKQYGMYFSETGSKIYVKEGFNFAHGDSNLVSGGGSEENKKTLGGIGSDLSHAEWWHRNYLVMHLGGLGESTTAGSAPKPGVWVGYCKDGQPGGNCVGITDSKGWMCGIDGKLYMKDSWAIPDNQFCIYARFG